MTQNMTQNMIRNMQLEDISAVWDIECRTFSQPWSQEGFAEALLMPGNHYVVCEVDDVIVGYCGYYGVMDEGEITNVAVDQVCRNHGYGAMMLQELKTIAEHNHIKRLVLEVRHSNESARHLYRKLGFDEIGIRKDFYQMPKEDAVIMECILKGKEEC